MSIGAPPKAVTKKKSFKHGPLGAWPRCERKQTCPGLAPAIRLFQLLTSCNSSLILHYRYLQRELEAAPVLPMPMRNKTAKKSAIQRPRPERPAEHLCGAILPVSPCTSVSSETQTDPPMAVPVIPDPVGSSAGNSEDAELDGEQSTAIILAAIADSMSSVEGKIDTLSIECGLIRQNMDKFRGRLHEAEQRISEVEYTSASTMQSVAELQQQVKLLMSRSEEAENRLRRNNVRVVGLPEGTEGSNAVVFAETFFKLLLCLQHLSPVYVVERAHRVPPVGGLLVLGQGLSWFAY